MAVGYDNSVEKTIINRDGYAHVSGKVLVSPENGWKDYVMREFSIEENGYTGNHNHDFPHIIFVINGEGTIIINDEETSVKKGSYAYVPANSQHQLKNTCSSETFSFLCIVPQECHTFG